MIELNAPFENKIDTSLDWDGYCAARGVNPSRIIQGIRSMKHFYAACRPDLSKPLLVGSLTHLLTFEPTTFSQRYAVYHGHKRSGKQFEQWQWKNPGREPCKADEYEQAFAISDAVRSDPEAKKLLKTGGHEVSLFVEDYGMQCKGRVDCLGERVLVDLKTTTDVRMVPFGRIFANLNYGARLACYVRWAQKLGRDIQEVFVIAVETKPPYDVAVIPIVKEVLEAGWDRAEAVLNRIRSCAERDYWPGVAEGRMYELQVPNWAMPEEQVLDWSE